MGVLTKTPIAILFPLWFNMSNVANGRERNGVNGMNNMKIKLNNPKEVEEFVNIASKCDFDIDLKSGNSYLDAKSFLGVLTQALEREMYVICHRRDELFNRAIRKFAVA